MHNEDTSRDVYGPAERYFPERAPWISCNPIPAKCWCRVTGLRRFAHSFRILFDDASHPPRRDWRTTSIARASRFDEDRARLDRISKAEAVARHPV